MFSPTCGTPQNNGFWGSVQAIINTRYTEGLAAVKYYLWVMFSAFGESNSIYRTCEFAFWEAELLLCNLVLGVVDKSVTFICWKIFSACVPFIETLIAKIR